jgi:serine/threonine protein phosphatase PrpC
MSNYGPTVWLLSGAGVARGRARQSVVVDLGLCVVAEGRGSVSGGGLAAELVVDLFPISLMRALPQNLERDAALLCMNSDAVKSAAGHVAECIEAAWALDDFYRGMAATFASVIALPEKVIIVHVGDCAVFRIRDAAAERLTTSHVLPSQPEVLMRTLVGAESRVDVRVERTQHGDKYLVCTRNIASLIDRLQAEARIGEHTIEELMTFDPALEHAACVCAEIEARKSLNELRRKA